MQNRSGDPAATRWDTGLRPAADLVESFRAESSTYEDRQITPTVWPGRDEEPRA
ncbi:hypothetical protein NJ7G_2383 [Natrinema sp. J7-2]|nr:hypothetical protein NJ7G_2383 [Natrinema sp. J7-2]